MGSKRRTKREKLISELRRKLDTNKAAHKPTNTFEEPGNVKIVLPAPSSRTQMNAASVVSKDYSYVIGDMKKTAIIVSLISFINVTIFLLLEKNVIHLRLLGF